MAQQNKPNINNNAATDVSNSGAGQQQLKVKPMLYDFLGMKPSPDSLPVVLAPKPAVSDPSLTSAGASSGAAAERQVGDHLEGIPFYGTQSDVSGPEISNKFAGSKRSNSVSAFMGHDYPENSHLMKILRNTAAGERGRRAMDDAMFYRTKHLRPTSAAVMLQPSSIGRIDANVSRWERTNLMSSGPAAQYPPRGTQLAPFMHDSPMNRLRDTSAGPSNISQSAADEGSRTGIKGSGILNSINAIGSLSEKNSSALLPSGSKAKSGTVILETESSTPSASRREITSAGRQMTIFYGGQAHVFDDVHPNKADVIMALAGSNGGSWSTSYSPKSTVRPIGENFSSSGDLETCVAGNTASPQEYRGRLSVMGNTSHGNSSKDRISTATHTGFQGGAIVAKDTRNPNQTTEPSNEEKR